ncbi:hypothetical protein ACBQ24_11725 [Acinetobacter terrestris]|uniref:hypothetical protein n=1 Tax=Acinetobacter terrestris TaxID=2529843 RepID=UPI003524EA44
MNQQKNSAAHISKVSQITLLFWMTQIFAIIFGETGVDAVSTSLNLRSMISTFIFATFFIGLLFLKSMLNLIDHIYIG